ncbi:MAG: hypothetical protein U9Q20_09055, partial [Campylobacterota bacterium]|nr:hypothetical protein [Campylobacterota bacterium]
MVKWVLILFVAVIGYMIYTGNMGGAKEATGNYVKVRHTQVEDGAAEARPNILHSLIKDNPFKSK